MKNIFKYLFLLCSHFVFLNSYRIEYRLAEMEDVPQILQLINKYAVQDSDKIVIVPEIFREANIRKNIENRRLFIAVLHYTNYCCIRRTRIIAFKKLFMLTDTEELKDVLSNEIRCLIGYHGLMHYNNHEDVIGINEIGEEVALPNSLKYQMNDVYIYNGADFTHPDFRGRYINRDLTEFAFNYIQDQVIEFIKQNNSIHIILLYGLTNINAGDRILNKRTESIFKLFINFAKNFSFSKSMNVFVYRYRAFMPTFDPKSLELKPLSDDQSIAGYGYTMISQL